MLVDGGLEVSCEVTNTGTEPAPFGIGFHPYLVPSSSGIDDAEIRLAAARRLLLDERALPQGDEPVAGSAFDLDGRKLDGLRLDDCYTGLQPQGDGRWHAVLNGPARGLALWADAAFGYAMCFTGDSLDAGYRRTAIAIEPMTCPPNALRTGTDLIALVPGEPCRASWGITDLPPASSR
jgi:aldose 1-epimerase